MFRRDGRKSKVGVGPASFKLPTMEGIRMNRETCNNREWGPCWLGKTKLMPAIYRNGKYVRKCPVCGKEYEDKNTPLTADQRQAIIDTAVLTAKTGDCKLVKRSDYFTGLFKLAVDSYIKKRAEKSRQAIKTGDCKSWTQGRFDNEYVPGWTVTKKNAPKKGDK